MLTKWHEVQVQGGIQRPDGPPVSKIRICFDLPRNKALCAETADLGVLAISPHGSTSRPWLLMAMVNTTGIAAALEEQKLQLKEKKNGKLVAGKIKKTRKGHFCWMGIRRKTGHTEWSLFKAVGDLFYVMGCKTDGPPPADFRRFATRLLNSIQIEPAAKPDKMPLDLPGHVIDQQAGLAILMPSGWERQDLLGVCSVYAPGEGFRARISYPFLDDTPASSEAVEMIAEYLGTLRLQSSGFRAGKLRPLNSAESRTASSRRFSGVLKRNQQKIQGLVIAIPARESVQLLAYIAKAGKEFRRFLPAFLETVKSVKVI